MTLDLGAYRTIEGYTYGLPIRSLSAWAALYARAGTKMVWEAHSVLRTRCTSERADVQTHPWHWVDDTPAHARGMANPVEWHPQRTLVRRLPWLVGAELCAADTWLHYAAFTGRIGPCISDGNSSSAAMRGRSCCLTNPLRLDGTELAGESRVRIPFLQPSLTLCACARVTVSRKTWSAHRMWAHCQARWAVKPTRKLSQALRSSLMKAHSGPLMIQVRLTISLALT